MILCADSISQSFAGQRVLSSARLAAEKGEVVGLLGRMGMGKSTLLKICAGVMTPDSGWVEFDGVQYQRPLLATLASRALYKNAGKLAGRSHSTAVAVSSQP
ncbi:MAG TPA: ATP-binding cassette domain-containing protein [Gemmatimonadaceae bacterium]|nr:ATP-binding cassette domain-containing protein [Gemmatimonadaceae bacterium]